MSLYEDRVKRLHDHVIAQEKKAAGKKRDSGPTLEDLKSLLTERKIDFDDKAKKDELLKLLEASEQEAEQ